MSIRHIVAASTLLIAPFAAVSALSVGSASAARSCFTDSYSIPPSNVANQGVAGCKFLKPGEKLRVQVDCSGYTPVQFGPWVTKGATVSRKTCPGGTYLQSVTMQIR